jgi:hypothetical protein
MTQHQNLMENILFEHTYTVSVHVIIFCTDLPGIGMKKHMAITNRKELHPLVDKTHGDCKRFTPLQTYSNKRDVL